MSYPNDLKVAGSAAADDALVFTSNDVSKCNEHVIQIDAGVADLEVCINSGIDPVEVWSDSSTFPIAVMLLNATSPSTWVTQISAGQIAVLTGRFDKVRARQKGATATSGRMSSYIR